MTDQSTKENPSQIKGHKAFITKAFTNKSFSKRLLALSLTLFISASFSPLTLANSPSKYVYSGFDDSKLTGFKEVAKEQAPDSPAMTVKLNLDNKEDEEKLLNLCLLGKALANDNLPEVYSYDLMQYKINKAEALYKDKVDPQLYKKIITDFSNRLDVFYTGEAFSYEKPITVELHASKPFTVSHSYSEEIGLNSYTFSKKGETSGYQYMIEFNEFGQDSLKEFAGLKEAQDVSFKLERIDVQEKGKEKTCIINYFNE